LTYNFFGDKSIIIFAIIILLFLYFNQYNLKKLNKFIKGLNDLKAMVEKSELNKLNKKTLIDKIINSENKAKKDKVIVYISAFANIILVAILVISFITPFFSGIQVLDGGENIELIPFNDKDGIWSIAFRTTGFIPSNNIILHVEFKEITAKIDYEEVSFNVYPDVIKAKENNSFEYKWNSYKGVITVTLPVSTSVMTELDTRTNVMISTDDGIKYYYIGI